MKNRLMTFIRTWDFSLFCVSLIITLFTVLFCWFLSRSYMISDMGRGGFTGNSVHIAINCAYTAADLKELSQKYSVCIYKSVPDLRYDIYGVIFPDGKNFSYAYGEGLGGEEKIVYTGSGYIGDSFEYPDGTQHTVGGKIGINGLSPLKYTVMFNLASVINEVAFSGTYIIDGNKKSVEKAVAELAASVELHGGTAKTVEFGKTDLIDIIEANDFLCGTFAVFLIVVLITVAVFASFWVEKQTKEILIKRLIGFSEQNINKMLLLRCMLVTDAAFLIGVVILTPLFLLLLGRFSATFYTGAIIFSFISINLLSVITIIIPISKFFKNRDFNALLK